MSTSILYAGQCSSNNSNNNKNKDNKQIRSGFGNNAGSGLKSKQRDGALDFLVAQKMIWKFLSADRIEVKEVRVPKYTKEELARKLGITIEELDKSGQRYFYKNIESKMLLPLVALYCSTKWAQDSALSR